MAESPKQRYFGIIEKSFKNEADEQCWFINRIKGESDDVQVYLNEKTVKKFINPDTLIPGTAVSFEQFDPKLDKDGHLVAGKEHLTKMEARNVRVEGVDSIVITPEPPAPAIPTLTVDHISLGLNRFGLTFALFIEDKATSGVLNFVPSEKIKWLRIDDPASAGVSQEKVTFFTEAISESGRFYAEVEVITGDPNIYVTVEGFDVEYTLNLPRFQVKIHQAVDSDPTCDHFFNGWQPMKKKSRAYSRVVFATLAFAIFSFTASVGWFGYTSLLLPIVVLTFGIGSVIFLASQTDKAKGFFKNLGTLLQPFLKKNNWLWFWILIMAIISLGLWAFTSSPVDLKKPVSAQEFVEEDRQRRANVKKFGVYKSDREIAEANPPAVDQNLVLTVRSYAVIILILFVVCYGPIAISDEIRRAYFAVADKFTTDLEGEASSLNWLQRLLQVWYGIPDRSAQPARAESSNPSTGGSFFADFSKRLVTEFVAEAAVEAIPKLMKRR